MLMVIFFLCIRRAMARQPDNHTFNRLMKHFGISDSEISQGMIDSYTRFPDAHKSLNYLRSTIGSPASNLDVSRLSPGFQEFPQILEAFWIGIMCAQELSDQLEYTFASIKHSWSIISPWIIFSMEYLLLATDFSAPVHRLFWILPLFLQLEGAEPSVLTTRNATPNLRQLIGRVWFTSIERNHATWGKWTELLLTFDEQDPRRATASLTEFRARVSTFTRHINQEASRMSIMPASQLQDVDSFLLVLLTPSLWGSGPVAGPFTAKASMEGGMKGFVRALSSLVCKRRSLRDPPTASRTEYNVARGITTQIFDYLTRVLQGRFLVLEALESGLISSLIKANPAFFVFESDQVVFDDAAANLFCRISVYLAYPSILHEVLRSIRGINNSREASLRLRSKKLWTAWQQLKGKALVLRDVRRALRAQRVYPLCAINEVSPFSNS
ncbi:hypothetical protein PM082_022145 [Marasmius tenuissimus]|nr:hypothetical protein PM082_022145 [Marasmius tenuissimus]